MMDNTPAVIQQDEPPLADFTVIARNPNEMAAAQQRMITWATAKIEAEQELLAEAEHALRLALDNAWGLKAWEGRVNLAARRVAFYKKLKVALDAGYYIVPPFPIDIFAIRTNRDRPNPKRGMTSWDTHAQTPQVLPAGAGRYVSDLPETWQRKLPGEKDGKPIEVTEYWAKEFREIDFPFKLAKPAILEATVAAMALKVFDQLGALPASAKFDPIICGQVLKPDRYRTPINFFVTWWLDTRTL